MDSHRNIQPLAEELVLDALRRIGGGQAVVAIQKRFGGTQLYIPNEIGRNHAISRTIGLVEAQLLSEEFAGCTVYIPSNRAQSRREAAMFMMLAKIPSKQIAEALSISQRQVGNIRRSLRREGALDAQSL